jgi:ankyrin repeat protein
LESQWKQNMAQHKLYLAVALTVSLFLTNAPAWSAKKRQDNVQSLLVKRQYKAALGPLQANAKAGSAKAQYQLGNLYRLGLGVAVDREKAAYWYGKAATGGHAKAKRILKRMSVPIPKTEKQIGLRVNTKSPEGEPDFRVLAERKVKGQSWLTLAAARGLPAVIDNLTKKPDTTFKNTSGDALLAAARSGKAGTVAILLNKGADPNSKDSAGQSATMIAASYGRVDTLRTLVAVVPDLVMNDNKGISVLGKSSVNCNVDAYKLLSDAGAKDKDASTPTLTRILQNCDHADVYFKDARPNALNATDAAGRSVFWHAAGKLDAVQLGALLAAGADPILADQQGYTPLHAAALAGRADNIAVLLSAVAGQTSSSINGVTPLMLAAYVGCVDCIQKLPHENVAINAKDNAGNSALMYAVLGKQKRSAEVLVSFGANLNAQNESGDTPIKLGKRIAMELRE